MLTTRLWMGALLVVAMVGILVIDQRLAPWFPVLFLLFVVLEILAGRELLALVRPEARPQAWFCLAAQMLILIANWPPHFLGGFLDPWDLLLAVFIAIVMATFLVEMAFYERPGSSVLRMALTVWIVAYLGLLPSFLLQLSWNPGMSALALAVFIPKSCDIGAYFTGRFLGRSPLTPILSPRKTREGLGGGLLVATLATFLLNRLLQVLPSDLHALGFGLTVGITAVLGDLAESLVKRDSRQKDASEIVPGFGGILDVVDSIIFAAPVAYCWFRFS